MLETQIRNLWQPRGLTIALLAASAALSSCASQKPQQTALVGDPDATAASSIPWNKPANWEGRGNLPTGVGTGSSDPFGGSGVGGTGGY